MDFPSHSASSNSTYPNTPSTAPTAALKHQQMGPAVPPVYRPRSRELSCRPSARFRLRVESRGVDIADACRPPGTMRELVRNCVYRRHVLDIRFCRCDTKSHLASGLADWRPM
jgi:hypothetical protein